MARFIARRSPADRPPSQRRRHRQHRSPLRQLDRSALERAGWRTTLELRENHLRSEDGRLIDIETIWVAEAERVDGDSVEVVGASARSESRAWARLLAAARSRSRGPTVGASAFADPAF